MTRDLQQLAIDVITQRAASDHCICCRPIISDSIADPTIEEGMISYTASAAEGWKHSAQSGKSMRSWQLNASQLIALQLSDDTCALPFDVIRR